VALTGATSANNKNPFKILPDLKKDDKEFLF